MKTKLFTIVAALAVLTIAAFNARADLVTGSEGRITEPNVASAAKLSSEKNASTLVHTPRNAVQPRPAAAADVSAPAANTAAVVTYAAVAAKKHVVTGVTVSYTGAGTLAGGNLKIEDVSGTTVFSCDIDAKGVQHFVFPAPKKSAAANTALIVTLAAGGANVTGKISVLNRWTED